MDAASLTIVVIAACIFILKWLDSGSTNQDENASTQLLDANIMTCKSDDDLQWITGRPVAPPDASLMRTFEEMDKAELRRYAHKGGYAAD